jgi:hypothetical protein
LIDTKYTTLELGVGKDSELLCLRQVIPGLIKKTNLPIELKILDFGQASSSHGRPVYHWSDLCYTATLKPIPFSLYRQLRLFHPLTI